MKNPSELIRSRPFMVKMIALSIGFALVVAIGVTSLSRIARGKA
jgi:hypothetical protein